MTHDGHTYHVFFNQKGKASEDDGSRDDGNSIMNSIYAKGPDRWFSMPPGDGYLEDFKTLQENHGFAAKYEPVNEWGQQMFSWIFFLFLMIAVWMFIMRRMGGGTPG